MKTFSSFTCLFIAVILLAGLSSTSIFAQVQTQAQTQATRSTAPRIITSSVPPITLANLLGDSLRLDTIGSSGKVTVFKFWSAWAASNCRPCELDLNQANQYFAQPDIAAKAQLLTINVDKNVPQIQEYVTAQNWNFEVLLDANATLQKSLGVTNVPALLIINSKGQMVYNNSIPQQAQMMTYEDALTRAMEQVEVLVDDKEVEIDGELLDKKEEKK